MDEDLTGRKEGPELRMLFTEKMPKERDLESLEFKLSCDYLPILSTVQYLFISPISSHTPSVKCLYYILMFLVAVLSRVLFLLNIFFIFSYIVMYYLYIFPWWDAFFQPKCQLFKVGVPVFGISSIIHILIFRIALDSYSKDSMKILKIM